MKVPLPPLGEFKELDRRLYFMVDPSNVVDESNKLNNRKLIVP